MMQNIDFDMLDETKDDRSEASRKVLITNAKRQLIRKEINRTGVVAAGQIVEHPDCPPGLTALKIEEIIQEEANQVQIDHWDFIVSRYKNFPDFIGHSITKNELAELNAALKEKKVTRISYHSYLKTMGGDEIELPNLRKILKGKISKVSAKQWGNLQKAAKEVPARIPVTKNMLRELVFEMDRTGVSHGFIVNQLLDRFPDFKRQKLTQIKQRHLRTTTEDEWGAIMAVLRNAPGSDKAKEAPECLRHRQALRENLNILENIRADLEEQISTICKSFGSSVPRTSRAKYYLRVVEYTSNNTDLQAQIAPLLRVRMETWEQIFLIERELKLQ